MMSANTSAYAVEIAIAAAIDGCIKHHGSFMYRFSSFMFLDSDLESYDRLGK
jgi:hypothetical protein